MNIDCVFPMFKFPYVSIGLGSLLLLSNLVWYTAYQGKDRALSEERSAHSITILNYKKAQSDAALLSTQKAREQEAKDAIKAQQANEAYSSLLSKYNASIVRYQATAAKRPAGEIYLSSTSTTTSGSDSTSESTRILITIDDAQICAENTARLKIVHDWATNR